MGYVLGIIGTVIWGLAILFLIAMIAFTVFMVLAIGAYVF